MEKKNYYDWFKGHVNELAAECRHNMETQPMTKALARDMFETANAMKNNYGAMKEESGKEDTTLEAYLESWYDYTRRLWQDINSLDNLLKI